jgi:hypothetical protein
VWVPESAHAAAVAHRCEHTQEIIMAMILPWSIYKPQILTSEDISPSRWFRRFFMSWTCSCGTHRWFADTSGQVKRYCGEPRLQVVCRLLGTANAGETGSVVVKPGGGGLGLSQNGLVLVPCVSAACSHSQNDLWVASNQVESSATRASHRGLTRLVETVDESNKYIHEC